MCRPKYFKGQGGKLVRRKSSMRSASTVDATAARSSAIIETARNLKAPNASHSPTYGSLTTDTSIQATERTRNQSPCRGRGHEAKPIDVGVYTVTNENKVSTEFEVALKKLQRSLPSTTCSRVSENRDQCIASKISPVGARCTRVLGRLCDAKGQLTKLVAILEANDHSFLSSLRVFMESALCGRSHKGGACMALQELQELEPTDAELEMVRAWLYNLLQVRRKAERTVDGESDTVGSVSHGPGSADKALGKKASNPRHRSSKDVAPTRPIRQLPNTSPEQTSIAFRSQKRKASTLLPPVEPKRIQDEGTQQKDKLEPFFGSMSPIVVSPTETTYDSPSEDENVFDEGFRLGSTSRASEFVVTPLTPPTSKGSIKVEATSPESPLQRRSNAIEAQIDSNPASAEDDDFKPGKIFRNTTFLMNNIISSTQLPAGSFYTQEIETEFRIRRSVRLEQARSSVKRSSPLKSATEPPNVAKADGQQALGDTTTDVIKATSGSVVSRTPAEKVLEHIIPFQVRKRLADDEITCVASLQNKDLTRCTNRAKKFPKRKPVVELEDIAETPVEALDSLQNCDENNDHGAFVNHIGNFIKQALCGSHAAPAWKRLSDVSTWLADAPASSTRSTSTRSRIDTAGFATWITAITSAHSSKTPVNMQTRSVSVPSSFFPRVLKFRGEHFEPYQPSTTRCLSVNQALRDLATKPLTSSEHNPGFIYVFWLRGVFGLVKIGLTKYPEERLEQWNRQCQRDHEYHAACYDADMIKRKINHVFRVEKLIHTELKDVRLRNKCQCGKVHREWFKGTEEHVLKVFLKWRNWIDKRPYEEDDQGNWTLKPNFEQSLDEVCRPSEEPKGEASSADRRRSTTRKRSAARRQSQK